jgi:hypothetical protein
MWYGVLLVSMMTVAFVVNTTLNSTLPWSVSSRKLLRCLSDTDGRLCDRWGLIIAVLLAAVSTLFFGAFSAITGITFTIQPFLQMIGGFLHPGEPMANMFFVMYSFSEFLIDVSLHLTVQDSDLCINTRFGDAGGITP